MSGGFNKGRLALYSGVMFSVIFIVAGIQRERTKKSKRIIYVKAQNLILNKDYNH